MATPTTLIFEDGFTGGSDGDSIDTRAPDVSGTSWDVMFASGTFDWQLNSRVTNSTKTPAVNGTQRGVFFATVTGGYNDDQASECEVHAQNNVGAIGPGVRITGTDEASFDGYTCGMRTDGTTLQLTLWQDGVSSSLTTATGTYGVGDTFKIEAVGTIIKVYQNGGETPEIEWDTSNLPDAIEYSSGTPGVYLREPHDPMIDLFKAWDDGSAVVIPIFDRHMRAMRQ